MSDLLRVELNYANVGQLLHEVGQTLCAEQAARIAAASGAETDVARLGTRTVSSVFTTDPDVADAMLRAMK